jgi:hypothetical protein
VTPIIDPERYWAQPKPICEVVVVIPALPEKPSAEPETEVTPKYYYSF